MSTPGLGARLLHGIPTDWPAPKLKPKVVTICGSMRFFEQMLTVAAEETAKGHIVLAPFCVVAPEDQGDQHKAMLDRLHFQKIDMSDEVIVVTNQDGYVGDSTRREMAYAIGAGKFDSINSVREFDLSNDSADGPMEPDSERPF